MLSTSSLARQASRDLSTARSSVEALADTMTNYQGIEDSSAYYQILTREIEVKTILETSRFTREILASILEGVYLDDMSTTGVLLDQRFNEELTYSLAFIIALLSLGISGISLVVWFDCNSEDSVSEKQTVLNLAILRKDQEVLAQ
jgi:hypothetical protein